MLFKMMLTPGISHLKVALYFNSPRLQSTIILKYSGKQKFSFEQNVALCAYTVPLMVKANTQCKM